MALAELLAVGTTDANSADLVVAAGSTNTVCLKGYTQNALCVVQLKDDGGAYIAVDELTSSKPRLVLPPGTWRVSRMAGASCGAFNAA